MQMHKLDTYDLPAVESRFIVYMKRSDALATCTKNFTTGFTELSAEAIAGLERIATVHRQARVFGEN